jgi:hypothetical protein
MVRVKFAVGDVLRVRGVSSSSAPLSGLCISGYKYYIRSYVNIMMSMIVAY